MAMKGIKLFDFGAIVLVIGILSVLAMIVGPHPRADKTVKVADTAQIQVVADDQPKEVATK